MPKPLEICLEELEHSADDDPFIRCVALPGDEPGLALDREGAVQWMPEGPGTYGLWVSGDDRLVLLRAEGAGPITVERGHRTVEAPVGKPVILLDQDLLLLDGRRLRVHVHGETEAVYAPERLGASAFGRLARAAAAVAALALGGGSAAAAGLDGAGGPSTVGEPAPIEVRTRPPRVSSRRQLNCTITRQSPSRKGPLKLNVTCPSAKGLRVGLYGTILDPTSGQPIKDGGVTVKTVSGAKLVVEAPRLSKAVQASTIRFWVSR